jgi:hypothetical protein
VERFHLTRSKLRKSLLVQLATRDKRRINEIVKDCPMDMTRPSTKTDLNIKTLGSYDCLIGMDWLDKHHVVLDCYNKEFTFMDEEGNLRTIQGIPRAITIKEIPSLQLNKSFKKGR